MSDVLIYDSINSAYLKLKFFYKVEKLLCSVLYRLPGNFGKSLSSEDTFWFKVRSEYEGILTAFEQYSCQVVFDGQDWGKVVANYK